MKVCIVGVGAIGGMIGYRLASVGCEVSGLARGATLEALRKEGLRYTEAPEGGPGGPGVSTAHGTAAVAGAPAAGMPGLGRAPIKASADAADLGRQDLVVLAVKGPALAAVAPAIAPLIGPETIVLPAMNGVPWWFFQGFGGSLAGTSLRSIDPEGAVARAIPPESIIGCVVHCGASCPEPGLVRALPRKQLILGEPSGVDSPRVRALADLLSKAGFDAPVSDCVQRDIWYKLWGNMTMNPISALTGATMDRILDDPQVAEFCRRIMEEARRVGAKIGCAIDQSVEARFAITRGLGAFKTSMLQDIEAKRPVELDALVAAPAEIGALVGEPTPSIDILLGLARLQARVLSLYPQAK
jgi:2-dehydropantoate 2-reductase